MRGFWIGKYEVTQAQYAAIMGINPSVEKFGHQYGIGENYPVYGVRWKDATNFCAKLTALEKDAGRLPYFDQLILSVDHLKHVEEKYYRTLKLLYIKTVVS